MARPGDIETAPPKDSEPEVQRYLRVLSERRWAVVFALAVGAVLYVWWAARQTRIYQANATIVVDTSPPQVLGGDVREVVQMGPGQFYAMQDYIQTQKRVLTSDSLARQAVTALNLMGDK